MSKTHRLEHAPVPHPRIYNATERAIRVVSRVVLGGTEFNEDGLGTKALWHLNGPAIIAPRHFSNWDIPVIASAVRRVRRDAQVHFMAKKELDLPVLGTFLEACGGFFVDRDGSLTKETRDHIKGVVAGRGLLGIFPEGTRSRTGQKGPLEEGVTTFARRHKLPVFPVGIAGTHKSDMGHAQVHFGEPLYLAGQSRTSSLDVLAASLDEVQLAAEEAREPRLEATRIIHLPRNWGVRIPNFFAG